jgi:BASS family bile acid:Na+ symporter
MEPRAIVPLLIQISTMLIIFSIGLRSRWGDLGYALARPRLLMRGFVAVYVAVPVTAFVAASLLPMNEQIKIGIVAMALSPLTPLVAGRMLKVGADTSYVIGVYVGLLMLAIVAVPATLAIATAITGGSASIGMGAVAWLVVCTILLPLVAGTVLAGLVPAAAPSFAKVATIAGYLMLAVMAGLILYLAGDRIVGLVGNGTILAIALAELSGLAAGHVLGGPAPGQRMALALAAASRHPGLAVLMVRENFDDPSTILAAVLLYLVVGAIVSAIYVRLMSRRLPREQVSRAAISG